MTIKPCVRVKVIASCIFLIFVFQMTSALYLKRSTGSSICSRSSTCGWEVYAPYLRTISYFVKSPCQCPASLRCVRYSDDVSISAYVHRCKP